MQKNFFVCLSALFAFALCKFNVLWFTVCVSTCVEIEMIEFDYDLSKYNSKSYCFADICSSFTSDSMSLLLHSVPFKRNQFGKYFPNDGIVRASIASSFMWFMFISLLLCYFPFTANVFEKPIRVTLIVGTKWRKQSTLITKPYKNTTSASYDQLRYWTDLIFCVCVCSFFRFRFFFFLFSLHWNETTKISNEILHLCH